MNGTPCALGQWRASPVVNSPACESVGGFFGEDDGRSFYLGFMGLFHRRRGKCRLAFSSVGQCKYPSRSCGISAGAGMTPLLNKGIVTHEFTILDADLKTALAREAMESFGLCDADGKPLPGPNRARLRSRSSVEMMQAAAAQWAGW